MRSAGGELRALLLPPGPPLRDAIAAALADGPAIAPLDPDQSPAALRRTLQQLRPHAIVTASAVEHPPFPATALAPDIAAVISTSGSTGAPKAVELPAAALRASALASLNYLSADASDGWLCCLPISHIGGFQVLVRAHLAGASCEMVWFSPTAVADSSARFVSLVPTMLHRLLEAGVDLQKFRAILLGGAPASPVLLDRARAAGATIITTYGMTETSGGCVYDGRPLPGVSVHCDESDAIVVTGPMLARGYRNDPALTEQRFQSDGFHTTDLGSWGTDGTLEIHGRSDDVINTGGVKVSASAVAKILQEHPALHDAAVVGIPDAEWGERVVAIVVPTDPPEVPALATLRKIVAEALGRAAAPRQLVATAALPRSATGKPDKDQLCRWAVASSPARR